MTQNMEEKELEEAQNGMTREVFYADVRFSRGIFENEWDKKIYLNAMEEAGSLLRIEVFAFCLLDDRLRLLTGGTDVKSRTVRRLVRAALEHFERGAELIGEMDAVPAGLAVRANVLRIENETDALAVLRYIHLTPYSEGYTISAQDYWWTSYSTYRGHYNWTLVNTAPVMRWLSLHDSRAVSTLTEYHRRGEALRNPVPACIRRGEYEVVPQNDARLSQGNINETFMVQA